MERTTKPANDIRVGFRTRVANIVSYAERLLRENNLRSLNFSAVGGSIGTLVEAVEVIKMTNKGLYQLNRLATISYQSVEEGREAENQRLYPKLEVILSLDKPTNPTEGYQEPLNEDERKKLLDIRDKRREEGRTRGRFNKSIRGKFQMRGTRGIRRGRFIRNFRGRPPMRARGRGRGRTPMRARGRGRTPMGSRPPMRSRGRPMRGNRNY